MNDVGTTTYPRDKVLQWLEKSILEGAFPGGQAIPSERELAARLNVARNTVSSALLEAERRGLLVRQKPSARKRFVAESSSSRNPLPFVSGTIYIVGGYSEDMKSPSAPRWSVRFMLGSLMAQMAAAGHHTMLLHYPSLTDRDIDRLLNASPAGIIMMGVKKDARGMRILAYCKARGVPAIVYGNHHELSNFDRVYSDHRAGSCELTRYLLQQGCRHIHVLYPEALTPEFPPWKHYRYEGYCDAMREAGIEPYAYRTYADIVPENLPIADEFRLRRALVIDHILSMQREGVPFDAFICITDHYAKVVISALRALGLRPNHDVLVAGYDNIRPDVQYDPYESEYPCVTIDKHNERIADAMAELLLDRLSGRLSPAPQLRTYPHELISLNPEINPEHEP